MVTAAGKVEQLKEGRTVTNKKKYEGIIPPVVTPLYENGELDEEGIAAIVSHCIAGGVTGLFVNGTSGEAMRISDSLWKRNMNVYINAVQDRIPVFCGAISASAEGAVEKIQYIEATGGKIAVCTPPFYLQNFGQDEIIRHMEYIMNHTNIDIAIYNIPETTHVRILPETVALLADYERIVILKDSTADWQSLQRILFLCDHKDIAVLNGAEELCATAMLFGAQGCIPGLANYIPKLFVRLYNACKAGKNRESYEIQKQIYRIRKVLFVNGCWLSGMKFLNKAFHLANSGITTGLLKLTEEQEQEAFRILSDNGIDIS